MKVSELEGSSLDYWVGIAEGFVPLAHGSNWFEGLDRNVLFSPSTDWSRGGPIIEANKICLAHVSCYRCNEDHWLASSDFTDLDVQREFYSEDPMMCGKTPLIAAMRQFVRSRFGDEVDEI